MPALLLTPSRPRLRIGLALTISALLHGAAIAVASLHRPAAAADFTTPWKDHPPVTVDLGDEPLPPTPPPDLPDLPPPPIPDDPPLFSDVAPPLPSRPTTLPPIAKRPPQLSMSRGTPSAKALALQAPVPEYPYEARRARITGNGVAILTVDPATGRVIGVTMAQSTGSAVLDSAARAGLNRWRFRPGSPAQVRCPITYTLTGAMF
ncbi:MAG: energy transducer TonB [Chthoniobacterales bacterium]